VPDPLGPAEPDECLGFCQADAAGSTSGHCWAECGLGNGCAWDAVSRRFAGSCHYYSTLAQANGVGDFAYCTPACNCAAECYDASLTCYALKGVSPLDAKAYVGPGLCFDDDPQTSTNPLVEQCQ
jgi:hypothetical protein